MWVNSITYVLILCWLYCPHCIAFGCLYCSPCTACTAGSTSIRGTPYWMAPEVIKQTGHGRPADIWSLACTVIEMATGKPPWSNLYSQPVSAMFHIASSKDPPKLPDHLSPEAKDFLMLCFNR